MNDLSFDFYESFSYTICLSFSIDKNIDSLELESLINFLIDFYFNQKYDHYNHENHILNFLLSYIEKDSENL